MQLPFSVVSVTKKKKKTTKKKNRCQREQNPKIILGSPEKQFRSLLEHVYRCTPRSKFFGADEPRVRGPLREPSGDRDSLSSDVEWSLFRSRCFTDLVVRASQPSRPLHALFISKTVSATTVLISSFSFVVLFHVKPDAAPVRHSCICLERSPSRLAQSRTSLRPLSRSSFTRAQRLLSTTT